MDAAAREFLSRIPIFGGLPDLAMDQLMPLVAARTYARDEVICAEGEPGKEMFVVRVGEVEVRKRLDGGGHAALARLKVGDCFGEMSLIDIQPRSASVIAIVDTTLWVLTNMDLYRLYQTNLEAYAFLVQNLCRELSRRLRRADGVIAEFSILARDRPSGR